MCSLYRLKLKVFLKTYLKHFYIQISSQLTVLVLYVSQISDILEHNEDNRIQKNARIRLL